MYILEEEEKKVKTVLYVKKRGEKIYSPYPDRRNLIIYVSTDLDKAINALSDIIKLKRDKEPWFLSSNARIQCKQCTERKEKEQKGEATWQRGLCMRHYLVQHLHEVVNYFMHDNKVAVLEITPSEIGFSTMTCNYVYDVLINDKRASLRCEYKDSVYTFSYRNHSNAWPNLSSYLYIVNAIAEASKKFYDELMRAKNNQSTWYNLIVVTPSEVIRVYANLHRDDRARFSSADERPRLQALRQPQSPGGNDSAFSPRS